MSWRIVSLGNVFLRVSTMVRRFSSATLGTNAELSSPVFYEACAWICRGILRGTICFSQSVCWGLVSFDERTRRGCSQGEPTQLVPSLRTFRWKLCLSFFLLIFHASKGRMRLSSAIRFLSSFRAVRIWWHFSAPDVGLKSGGGLLVVVCPLRFQYDYGDAR